jgi:tetratricopeptide (TPR) repeat protein
MKALKRYYSRKEQNTLFINSVFLLIFILFSINLMVTQDTVGGSISIAVILVFFTASMILKECLNYIFQKAIYQLTTECDPYAGYETMKVLRKWDILRSYTISYVAFCSLVYIDTENTQALFDLFSADNKLTQSGKDMILIKNYSLYKAYVLLNNKTQIKKAYAELIKLKVLSGMKKGVSPLYAWFDIEAEFALLTNDFKEANSILSKADISALNTRERAHHYYLVGLVEREKGNSEEALSYMNQVNKIANRMAVYDKARRASEEINNEKTKKAR